MFPSPVVMVEDRLFDKVSDQWFQPLHYFLLLCQVNVNLGHLKRVKKGQMQPFLSEFIGLKSLLVENDLETLKVA